MVAHVFERFGIRRGKQLGQQVGYYILDGAECNKVEDIVREMACIPKGSDQPFSVVLLWDAIHLHELP